MNVLLATDGSPSAEAAVRLLRQLVWSRDDHLEIITVEPAGDGRRGRVDAPLPAFSMTTDGRGTPASDDLLCRTSTLLQEVFPTVCTRIHVGPAAAEVLSAASEIEADLIVVGHRNRTILSQWVLGSVARAVVDHAGCSVLVVHPGFERLENVLLAYDGSQESDAALYWLAGNSLPAHASVQTLSVCEPVPQAIWALDAAFPVGYEMQMAEVDANRMCLAQQLSERATGHLQAAGKTSESCVARGDAAHEIVKAAHRSGANLVAVGAHSRVGWWQNIVGNTARAVASHGTFSTLVARSRLAHRKVVAEAPAAEPAPRFIPRPESA